jgi:BTB/POZ domain
MEPIVTCIFENVVWGDSTHYTCHISSCYPFFVKANTKIGALQGVHMAGKSNDDVTAISIKAFQDKFVPRGLNTFFQNLEILEISNGLFRRITPRDLIGLEGLKELHITKTFLKYLPDNLFGNLRKLRKVSFSSRGSINHLEFISSKLFTSLPENQLTFVDLRGDRILTNLIFDATNPETLTFKQLITTIDEEFKKPVGSFQHTDYQQKRDFRENFADKFLNNFEGLWNSKRFSDFKIIVGAKEFLVHKTVLGSQSSIFAAMFESDVEETRTGKMTITDFSAEAVEEFLRHFYTGELPSVTNAMEMFALSSKYDVPGFVEVSEELITENIDDSNAIEVFNVGHLFDSNDMKALALNEIKRMHPELTLTNELLKNPRKLLEKLGLVEVEKVKNEEAITAEEEEPPAKKRKIVVQKDKNVQTIKGETKEEHQLEAKKRNVRRKKSKTEETCIVKQETKEELQAEKRLIRHPKRFLN